MVPTTAAAPGVTPSTLWLLTGPLEPITEESILWVRWNAAARAEYGWLEQAIIDFDPGQRPAGQAAAQWLREHSLDGESQPYLAVVDRSIVGFYALTVGQVVLSGGRRKKLGLTFLTQGAVLMTWIAKSARHALDGGMLVTDALSPDPPFG